MGSPIRSVSAVMTSEGWLSGGRGSSSPLPGRRICDPMRPALVFLLLSAAMSLGAPSAGAAPRTIRVDYFHTGTATEERFALDRVVVEPLEWPGNPARTIDDTDLGKYFFEVSDHASGRVLYSRGFASVYGVWETTPEAKERARTFSESLRFPTPGAPVQIVLKKRDARDVFQEIW